MLCGTALAAACSAGGEDPRRLAIDSVLPVTILAGDELYRPASVALDARGRVYVLDSGAFRLFVYEPAGELLMELGRAGQGPGEFPELEEVASRVGILGDDVVVAMARAQRLQAWDTASWEPARPFRLPLFPYSVALDSERIIMTGLQSLDVPANAIYEYTANGEYIAGYGERLRPELEGVAQPIRMRGAVRSFVAVGAEGMTFEFFMWWPLLRAYRNAELVWEEWLGFEWLEGTGYEEALSRPRSLLEQLGQAEAESDWRMKVPLAFDIKASRDRVFVLLAGALVQTFNYDGTPGSVFRLTHRRDEAGGAEPEPVTAFQLAVNEDGTLLCVPVTHSSKVLCYRPPGGNGAG